MLNLRLSRYNAVCCIMALTLFVVSSHATAQVTVNAPKGILNRDQPKTGKEKPKQRGNDSSRRDKPATPSVRNFDDKSDDAHEAKSNRRSQVSAPKDNYRMSAKAAERQVSGFRIQVLFSSSRNAREEAKSRARNLALKFPQYRSYISYNAPQWRLRIGDFRNRDDAGRAMSRLRNAFPAYSASMIVVRDVVNIWPGGVGNR